MKKKHVCIATMCMVFFLLTACSNGDDSNNATQQESIASKEAVQSSSSETEENGQMKTTGTGENIQTENKNIATRVLDEGTKINLYFGDTVVSGTLNDSKASQELIGKLPYTVRISKYATDLCGVMSDELSYNEEDVKDGWLNGDISYSLSGNWFVTFFGGENGSDGPHVNLGKIEGDLSQLEKLRGSYELRIELAE